MSVVIQLFLKAFQADIIPSIAHQVLHLLILRNSLQLALSPALKGAWSSAGFLIKEL